jgi:hypothetical protein
MSKIDAVSKWIEYVSVKRKELGGHAICPFAAAASVEVIECNLIDIALNSDLNAEIIIFIVEDDVSEAAMLQSVSMLNMAQNEYIVLDDHKHDPSYINGVQTNFGEYNIVLCSKIDKLVQARKSLHQTNYYSYWSPKMYTRIVHGK